MMIWYPSLNVSSDLTWHMFTHVVHSKPTQPPRYLCSWCLYPTHASTQCKLFIMHDYDHFCSLVGRFSTYLLAFACTKREYCLCIKILKPKVIPDESTISTYMQYYLAVPGKFACATSKYSNEHLFCVLVPLMERQGDQYLPR